MRPHPRYAETDASAPRGWATCERCGFLWNLHKLRWQFEWRGIRLDNTRHLVCDICLDEPQRQLGTVILPPDPLSLLNARPENYTIDEETFRIIVGGQQRYTQDGTARVECNLQGGPPLMFPTETTNTIGLGNNFGSGVGLITIIPDIPVPAGSLIVVGVVQSVPPGGSVTDSAGNSYTGAATIFPVSIGSVEIFFCANVAALKTGDQIVYHSGGVGDIVVSAFYATHIKASPLDGFASAGSGTSATPSVSFSASTSDLVVALVGAPNPVPSVTQASGWSFPFGQVSVAPLTMIGGTLLNVVVGTQIYGPALGASSEWAAVAFGFKIQP